MTQKFSLLSLPAEPSLRPATITGGVIRTWADRSKALVNGPTDAIVEGWAYEVSSKECEEALRFYEAEKYEVSGCRR
jgi:hypothetical protein